MNQPQLYWGRVRSTKHHLVSILGLKSKDADFKMVTYKKSPNINGIVFARIFAAFLFALKIFLLA